MGYQERGMEYQFAIRELYPLASDAHRAVAASVRCRDIASAFERHPA